MKKLTPVALAFLFVVGMSSCKKDYTCTCTYPDNPDNSYSIDYTKVKKKTAESICTTLNALEAPQASCILLEK